MSVVSGASRAALVVHSLLLANPHPFWPLIAAGLSQAWIPPPSWAEAGKILLHWGL